MCPCVYTHFHMHTHTQTHTHTRENTFIRVVGLHRDKARLLILTHWLSTHTHTLHLLTLCTYTNTYPHIENRACTLHKARQFDTFTVDIQASSILFFSGPASSCFKSLQAIYSSSLKITLRHICFEYEFDKGLILTCCTFNKLQTQYFDQVHFLLLKWSSFGMSHKALLPRGKLASHISFASLFQLENTPFFILPFQTAPASKTGHSHKKKKKKLS